MPHRKVRRETSIENEAQERKGLKVPRTVWALGFVSLLMDISSEMIHALLPLLWLGH